MPLGQPVPGAPGRRRLWRAARRSLCRDAGRERRGSGHRAVLPLGDGRAGGGRRRRCAGDGRPGAALRVSGKATSRRPTTTGTTSRSMSPTFPGPIGRWPNAAWSARRTIPTSTASSISSRRRERRCCSPSSTRCGACAIRCTAARSSIVPGLRAVHRPAPGPGRKTRLPLASPPFSFCRNFLGDNFIHIRKSQESAVGASNCGKYFRYSRSNYFVIHRFYQYSH